VALVDDTNTAVSVAPTTWDPAGGRPSRSAIGWLSVLPLLVVLVILGGVIVFLALVVAPAAGAAGGCGGG